GDRSVQRLLAPAADRHDRSVGGEAAGATEADAGAAAGDEGGHAGGRAGGGGFSGHERTVLVGRGHATVRPDAPTSRWGGTAGRGIGPADRRPARSSAAEHHQPRRSIAQRSSTSLPRTSQATSCSVIVGSMCAGTTWTRSPTVATPTWGTKVTCSSL